MNNLAEKFITSLRSSFTQKWSEEGKATYMRRASKFMLTASQWTRVLDRLIDENEGGFIIPWPQIEDGIRRELESASEHNLGWLYFDSGGRGYAVRVKNDRGVWVNASCPFKYADGKTVEMGRNIGQPPNLPDDAINVKVSPDYEADPRTEDIPTTEERREIIAKINRESIKLVKKLGGACA